MKDSLWEIQPEQERFHFPQGLYRVTAGRGGEAILIDGGEETAIYDCGMAYCHQGLIDNIEKKLSELGRDKLNKVIVSHSHYDHIGALPYIIDRWADVQVIGGEKLKRVFASDTAKGIMKRLGESARDKYTPDNKEPIKVDGMRVDLVVDDGDTFNVGRFSVQAIKTPGHTDCSFSYYFNPGGILFMSESLGVLENNEVLHTSILKSYKQTIDSCEKCRSLGAKVLISSHYGIVPDEVAPRYFDMYTKFANEERDLILSLYDQGLDFDGIQKGYIDAHWSDKRDKAQPRAAFMENSVHTINCIIKEFRNKDGE